ncbi:hypothetical protein DFH09DRAFT_1132374 [Mycena vulgaris]|nr:hypothetical protein DFH09DRAFT_1132374 [Mycena vulgaris]
MHTRATRRPSRMRRTRTRSARAQSFGGDSVPACAWWSRCGGRRVSGGAARRARQGGGCRARSGGGWRAGEADVDDAVYDVCAPAPPYLRRMGRRAALPVSAIPASRSRKTQPSAATARARSTRSASPYCSPGAADLPAVAFEDGDAEEGE